MMYYEFFEKYGDHVYTKCSLGGVINQFIATGYKYWVHKTIEEIKSLSEKTLIVGVEKSKKDRFKIDPKFMNASTVRMYKYFGGAFPEFDNNWNKWSESI